MWGCLVVSLGSRLNSLPICQLTAAGTLELPKKYLIHRLLRWFGPASTHGHVDVTRRGTRLPEPPGSGLHSSLSSCRHNYARRCIDAYCIDLACYELHHDGRSLAINADKRQED